MLLKTFCAFFILFIPVSSYAGESAEFQQYEWFWMFYEQNETEDNTLSVYRPFYLKHSDLESDRFYEASLMPVLFWRYKTERQDTKKALLGFVSSVDYIHSDGDYDYDFGFFPFVFYGNSPREGDRYFMLWPFGGTIKGKLAHDEINTFLFPGVLLFYFFPPSGFFTLQTTAFAVASMLPLYSTYSQGDYEAWSIMWPLIKSGKSDIRNDIRILPFYGRRSKEDRYDARSYFLLINYQETYFLEDTRYTFFFLPIYGRKWSDSGRISSTTILWPFFSWGYDKKNEDYQYNLPWPLVQIRDSKTPDIKRRIFFPFYGYHRYERSETRFVTPLYFNLKKTGVSVSSDYHYIALILWGFSREYTDPHKYYGNKWSYLKLWPLFAVEAADNGYRSFNTLSLLPFRDRDGYQSMYEPLWSILEYRKYPSGETHFGMLMRTWYHRRGDDFFDARVPLVFTYQRFGEEKFRVSLLLRCFEYNTNLREKVVRILWLPVYRKDKELTSEEHTAYGGYPEYEIGGRDRELQREPHIDDFRRNKASIDNLVFSKKIIIF